MDTSLKCGFEFTFSLSYSVYNFKIKHYRTISQR